ncbi:protein ELC-like [Oryza glaberrima]|uniref:UEV domain-containing protein n=1 Tax=Oryza glaberrima TaxID=4538 RepID=I1P5X0_ORYGL|nr:protein ELC-like [Oryza glaberrima]XP_052143730.1 protein ELC-like [Oryza glaberrima]XP_052143731.1 protein ELC-like [Oryza glaberrima]
MAPPPPSPSPSPASGAQYAHQFLNTALSQRGPSALPYAEDVKWLIRNHLVALADAFPSLHPKAALFTHNDGRAAHLLQADGTIPIHHAGASYNLPAVLWLPEPYPRSPPLVFLSPTRDMVIKPHHPLVDRSGLVANAPYLRSWVFPSSNLVDLVRSLSHLFGLDPPLFTRSPNPPPPSPSPPIPATPLPRVHPSSSSSPSPSPYRFPASPQLAARPPPTEDPAEVYKRNAIAKLVDMAYADAATLRPVREAEVDTLFAMQATLRSRGEVVSDGVRKMGEEKEALERRLQDVMMATDLMEAWVMENAKGAAGDTEADEAIETADVLSKQMLECTAADLALEDTIYALDKAIQEGSVPFDGYLRSVRALAREQFFQRVLSTKVNKAQQQAQVARMAARAPQYAS